MRICGLLDLVVSLLGEGDDEETDEVVISCLDHGVGFDQTLPFADEGAELVRGEVETVEVGQTVLALNFVYSKFDLAECVIFILLEVGEGDFEYPALECVVGILETSGAVDEGFADSVREKYVSQESNKWYLVSIISILFGGS